MNKGRFTWSEECEEAFKRLKEMLSAPLVLIKLRRGEFVYLYLGATERVVSMVMTQKMEKDHKPIYFVSRTLQGAEMQHQKLEKATLAIVVTAR